MEMAILGTLLIMIYFIPTMIGSDKEYATGIMLLNLFLGWTFVGWVVALIWAVSSPKKRTVLW